MRPKESEVLVLQPSKQKGIISCENLERVEFRSHSLWAKL